MDVTVSEPIAQQDPLAEPRRECALKGTAFGEVYEEHSRAIYYLTLRLLGDPDKAEDATHDVFLKAFRKIDQFRG
ncbi:hypothetical protein EG834_21860, partial [bacterium]|nr:hypothetical protein [bacterium]